MSRAPDRDTFVAALRCEVSAYEEFIALLREEQACLTRAETDPLPDLARRKEDKVEELNALARLRCAFLESQALPANRQGMHRWLESHQPGAPSAGELTDLWEHLAHNANEAQRLNRSNGKIINHRMTFTRGALQALSGFTRSTGVYDRDGFTPLGVTHRNFGAA